MQKIACWAVKGGTGKSTVVANLAFALRDRGYRVGALDVDISCCSLHKAFSLNEPPRLGLGTNRQKMLPPVVEGVKLFCLSSKFTEDAAIGWSETDKEITLSDGSKVVDKGRRGFIREILTSTIDWGELDYLICDLPPACLPRDSLILTARGPVPISEVKRGEIVYSFEGALKKEKINGHWGWRFNGEMNKNEVRQLVPQGISPVFILETPTRRIEATANHPFLTVISKKNGHREYGLEWRNLSELHPGDLIMVAKELPDEGKAMPLELDKPNKYKGLYKKVSIPRKTTEDFMRIIGYFLGDGLLRGYPSYTVTFYEPVCGKYRKKYINLVKRVFNVSVKESQTRFIVYSKQIMTLLSNLGFDHTSHDKTIPSWCFGLPKSQKLALIEGYCDADGHWRKDTPSSRASRGKREENMEFKCANKQLMKQLQVLALTVGLQVNKLRTGVGKSPSTGRKLQTYGFSIVSHKNRRVVHNYSAFGSNIRIGSHRPPGKRGLYNQFVGFQRVRTIKPLGNRFVYDLVVDNSHNFIAEGIVVHNSGTEVLSFFDYLQDLYGIILVSQPSSISVVGLRKTVDYLKTNEKPILGLVENMAMCLCPHCGAEFYSFVSSGVDLKKLAKEEGIPFLVSIPQVSSMGELKPYFAELAEKVIKAKTKVLKQSVLSTTAKVERAVIKKGLGL